MRDRSFQFTAVSMGNPHAVIFVDDGSSLRTLAESFGPVLETAERFPNRTNVEFAHVRRERRDRPGGLGARQRHHAGVRHRRLRDRRRGLPGRAAGARDRDARAPPGRNAGVIVDKDYSSVRMRGPAHMVFEASIDARAPRSAIRQP